MRALSILVNKGAFEDKKIKDHYKTVGRRNHNPEADTLVFENMMMAFHNQASLVRLTEDVRHPYDVCRSAIISWYYGTYFTCSAMIAATSGSKQETHAHTAKVWQSDIVDHGLVMPPFSLNLSSLVKNVIEKEISTYRGSNKFDLNTYAENDVEAWGAVVSYLNGTWEYEKWRVEERVKASREFKALGVDSFRTKTARELRDTQLAKNGVNYLIQAFRYRGKANYRDSIFLSYGHDNSEKVKGFVQDLEIVSRVFQRMAAFYLSRRVEKGAWSDFIDDLAENSRLSLEPQYLEV
ncbi:MAG: hypothetical protein MN733_19710 [Nitrososphaera sp.]|nr:hypothetical protein [Nitrososphaera sp.]